MEEKIIHIIQTIIANINLTPDSQAIASCLYYDCIKGLINKMLKPGELLEKIKIFCKKEKLNLTPNQLIELENSLLTNLNLKQESCALYADESSTIIADNSIFTGFDRIAVAKNNSFISINNTNTSK